MPELPEVETIANSLRPMVSGRTITGVMLTWHRTLATPMLGEFERRLLHPAEGSLDHVVPQLAEQPHRLLEGRRAVGPVHRALCGPQAVRPCPGPHLRGAVPGGVPPVRGPREARRAPRDGWPRSRALAAAAGARFLYAK